MHHLVNKIVFSSLILQLSVLAGSHDSFAATLSEPVTGQSENKNSQLAVADESEGALEDLLGILSKETEIATKTKMNIDFVPGMVTVLHGKVLLAKGVANVFDALKLVPGVDLNIGGDGQTQLIFRGLGKLFGSGKVKVLVNGIGFNNTFTAQTQLNGIPIEQVERIEVIRGPGSTIHGEFAFAGVIDVITKNTDSEVFARVGDLNSRMLGGIYVHKDKENDFAVSLNVSVSESDPDNVFAGEDALFGTPLQGISNSPGPVNDDEEHLAAIFKIDYKGMTFTGEKTRRAFGSFFGAANNLPDENSGIIREADNQVFEFTTPIKINDSVTSKLKAGWANFEFEAADQMVYPAGFPGSFPNGTPGVFSDGVLATPHYEEDKYYVGYEMHFPELGDHDLLLGVDYARIEQGDTHIHRNSVPNPAPPPQLIILDPPQKFTGNGNWMTENNSRSIIGLFVQDQYFITESFNITAGIRFDDYDDVGSSTSPRLSAVYHLSDHQILKAQYAEAFRPPTFVELYSQNNPIVNGNADLQAETIKSYEIGYVYNNGISIGRITLFTADLEDLIGGSNTAPVTFQNIGQAEQAGIELEYVRQIGKSVKLDSNLSYVEVTDQVTNTDFAEIANIQANIGVIYQPFNDFSLNGQYRFTGEKDRVVADTRSVLESFNTIDITASFFNFLSNQLTFRVGVKNLFDEDLFYPAPINTYVDDYPQPGREWWTSLAYKF